MRIGLRPFGRLFVNEQVKLYGRTGTKIMIALLLLLVAGAGWLAKSWLNDADGGKWRQELTQQNAALHKQLQPPPGSDGMPEPALSAKQRESLERQLAMNEYRLAYDVPSLESGIGGMWSFALLTSSGVPDLIDVVTLFTIIVAAGIVASEFSAGTIKLLLIRPFGRGTILLAKYATTLAFAMGLLVLLFLASLLAGGLLFGFGGMNEPYLVYAHGEVVARSMFVHAMQSYGAGGLDLLLLATLAFLLSAAFRSSSMAIGLGLFLLFAGPQLAYLLQQYKWTEYVLFANMNVSRYFDEAPFRDGMTLSFSLVVLGVYYVCFLAIAWTVFRRRDVAG